MSIHPLLVPSNGAVAVRWLCHTDGRCHGREYVEANRECKPRLLALAAQVAVKGYVGKQPENGHRLEGGYRDLYELKPGDHRFFGFRYGDSFYICSGARKNPKLQEADYAMAKKMRSAFMEGVSRKGKNAK